MRGKGKICPVIPEFSSPNHPQHEEYVKVDEL
jgi:hypothetical protein